jgi:hypothetical protein
MRCLLIAAVVCSLLGFGRQAGALGAKPTWCQLAIDETYLTDFSLKAGESKPVEIRADRAIRVGYHTDLLKQVGLTAKDRGEYIDQVVIRLIQPPEGRGIYSTLDNNAVFRPRNGIVSLIATNDSDRAFRIVIFTKK